VPEGFNTVAVLAKGVMVKSIQFGVVLGDGEYEDYSISVVLGGLKLRVVSSTARSGGLRRREGQAMRGSPSASFLPGGLTFGMPSARPSNGPGFCMVQRVLHSATIPRHPSSRHAVPSTN